MNTVQKAKAWLNGWKQSTYMLTMTHEADEIITALLTEREAFVALLQDMLESDAQMGRITDAQVQKATQLCEESK